MPNIIFLIFFQIIQSILIRSAPINNSEDAKNFLSHFGYLNAGNSGDGLRFGELMSVDTFTKAIIDFQTFYGLNVTGNLDNETKRMMSLPRCGVRDILNTTRIKRYIREGSKWKKMHVKYNIAKYSSTLGKEDTDKEISRAYNIWSEVSPLTFEKTSDPSQADVEIRFESYRHKCEADDPFDGPGNTLAHAFFPRFGGDAHFDNSEKWTSNSYRGVNLYQVAAHEFGHSLGLSHSSVRDSIMFPTYVSYDPDFTLARDDIKGIQMIYGPKTVNKPNSNPFPGVTSTTTPSTDTSSTPDLCSDGSFDTIFTSKLGLTYIFKGQHFWRLSATGGIAVGYPKLIADYWSHLPSNVDAAFTDDMGKTFFFKGSKYWKYDEYSLAENYPKNISIGFPGVPDDIQGAFMSKNNRKVYFFKGKQYWKYNSESKPRVPSDYPKPISNLKGVPDDIDDVYQFSNNILFFFKKGKYWKFNVETMEVFKTASYPKSVAEELFFCTNGY